MADDRPTVGSPGAPEGGRKAGRVKRLRQLGRLGRKGPVAVVSAPTEQERTILEALGDLRDMDVREVMTPRVDVVALSIPVTVEAIAQAVRETGHRCFPVMHDDLDDLVGVLYVNDLFRTTRRVREAHLPDASPLEISRRVREPLLIPESLGVLEALADMRRQRRGFAVVVDEYGGVSGVLTVRDLLEPLVGELHDEFDRPEEPQIVRVDRSRWLVDGRASVDDVRERLGVAIPDGDYVTLGGFLFDRLGHIPGEGEEARVGEWELRVVEMDRRRISQVLAQQVTAEQPGGEGEAGEAGGAGRQEEREESPRMPAGPPSGPPSGSTRAVGEGRRPRGLPSRPAGGREDPGGASKRISSTG